jgi:COX assembly protein 2
MHTDLSKHLHTPECNELIDALQKCHVEQPFKKFLGACNEINSAMLRCLKEERLEKRRANFEKSSYKKIRDKQLEKEKRSSE